MDQRSKTIDVVQPFIFFNELSDFFFVLYPSPSPPQPRSYSPKNPSLVSETVHYKRGVSQQFSMPSFKIDFSEWKEEDVSGRRRRGGRHGGFCLS